MSVSIFKKLLICLFASSILVGCNISGEPDFDLDDQSSLAEDDSTPAPEDKSPAPEDKSPAPEDKSPAPEDNIPDAFSFTPLVNVARDVQLLSKMITITGINIDIPVVISGGEYSINGGTFTSAAGTIGNNQTLQLRSQTPVNYSDSKTINITLGSTSVALLVQTFEMPEMLSISLIPTPEIRVGDNVLASSACNHCDPSKTRYEWSVEGIAQVVSTENFYQIPAEYELKEISITAIAVNGVGDEGNSITQAFSLVINDHTPDAFSFTPLVNVARDVQLLSQMITISGINIDIPVVISGGEYSINGGAFTSTAGTIGNNQTLQLRTQTPVNYSDSKTINITLGSTSVALLVQTPEAPEMLSISLLPTPEIRVGDNVVASIACNHCDPSKTRFEWNVEGIAQVVSTENFYQVPAEYELKEISVTAIAVNGVGDEGNSVTQTFSLVISASTPDDFSFASQADVARDVQLLSEIITITGINIDIPVVISGGEYSINGGAFTSAAGTIGNNQTLQLRAQTPVDYSDSKTITITLGPSSVTLLVQTPESPEMLSISLLPTPEIRVGENVIASSTCAHCDPTKTRYEWNVEGIAQVVSTENFYQAPDEYKLKKISVTAIAINGVGDEGNSITQTFSLVINDSTPDDFSFAPQTDVARDVQLLSEMITITGINIDISVVITGGEYSIDGGAFTSAAGTISNNQTLQLRAQTPVSYSGVKGITIVLGSVNVVFVMQTPLAPEMLSISLIPTPEIRVGDNVVASVTCNHCDTSKTRYEWSVEGITQIVSTENFYQVPAEYELKEISVTAIAVNGVGDEGNSITQTFSLVINDSTPDDFSFAPLTNVARDVQLLSEMITITGINIDIPVVISGGEYSINGGAFTSTAGTIGNNQTLQLRAQTPVNYSDSKTINITLGSTSVALLVQTPETPEMLSISLLPTPEIRVGENVIASSTCAHCDPTKTRYEWNVEGVAQVVSTENFYQAPDEYKLKKISVTAIAVNGVGDEGNSVTQAFSLVINDSTPDAFGFTSLKDVDRDVQLVSEIITITGINVEIPVVIVGGEYSIDGGAFTTTAGTISNNQTLQLRIQTPLNLSESKSITISLGSSSTSFFVHTSEVPKMLILYFLPGSELAVDKELAVNSDCSHCDPAKTRYEWKVEGSDQVVSNNASYLVPIEHVLKKISITATAINAVGDEGSSITRTYGLNRVKEIVGADGAFAALMFDGTVITWGDSNSANNLAVASELTQIISIVANEDAFAAIKNDGSVVTWGESRRGGNSSSVADQLIGVQSIVANKWAFSAIKSDGTVVTWGDSGWGGNSSLVADQLITVQSISATDYSFAAIRLDGSVVTWGVDSTEGDSASVAGQLTAVRSITGSTRAFAAVNADGSVVTWGDSSYGGDSSSVDEELVGVRSITATHNSFAAIRADGSVVTWGSSGYGGDSRSVASQLINIQSIVGNTGAFAAIRADGAVVTWGYDTYGADSDNVADQLTDVREIISTASAFSAIKIDGSVVTWGDAARGGDSSEVADQLTLVQAIYSTRAAFAAINGEGSIVTWGSSSLGADTSSLQDRLTQVKSISATNRAFAAIKEDGSVVAWGGFDYGGNTERVIADLYQIQSITAGGRAFAAIRAGGSVVFWGSDTSSIPSSSVADQLNDIQSVATGSGAFAAIKNDGTVVTWGNSPSGGDSSSVSDQLTQIEKIIGNYGAFAAIKTDGSVLTWGVASSGGDSSSVESELTTVVSITQTNRAFAAAKEDGSVVTWGNSDYGGDSSSVASELTDVKSIAATYDSFAALKNDGSVVTWGGAFGGSNSSSVADQLTTVKSIAANDRSFAAIKEDGSVVTWGDSRYGGGSNAVADQLTDVQSISATGTAFAALKADGSVVTWGNATFGGDSSSVASRLTQVKSITGTYGAFAAVKEDGSVVVWGGSIYGAYMQDTTGLQP